MSGPTTPSQLNTTDVNRAMEQVSGGISQAAGEVSQYAQDQLDLVASHIRKKPMQSAAIAAGVGFLLAVIARR